MTAFPNDPGHFVRWLVSRGEGTEEELSGKFVRRGLFGAYVSMTLEKAIEESAGEFHHVAKRILSIEPVGEKLNVKLGERERLFNDVVLALGNTKPRILPSLADLSDDPRVILNPWDSNLLGAIGPEEDVLLVGTGLTFIDTVLTLTGKSHKGRIVGTSRSGHIPHRHAPSTAVHIDAQEIPSTNVIQWIVAKAREAGGDWRGVVDGLRPHTQRIWAGLTWDERRRLIAHISSYWDIHRHRVPPQQADRLDAVLRSGQVEIKKSYLPKVDGVGEKLRLEFRTGAEYFDRIISCTGPNMYWERQAVPVLTSAVSTGLAEYDPLGIGLMVDPDGRVGSSGKLWALGNLCRGCRWETTAIPELRVQAQRLAECILGEKDNSLPA